MNTNYISMKLLNTNQVQELTRIEDQICRFIMAVIMKETKKIPYHGAQIGQKWDYIEGQYKGKYYFRKEEFPTPYIIYVGNEDIVVRFWLTDNEIHIWSLEVANSLRGNGRGSFMLSVFKAIAEDLKIKVTLRVEPIELYESMNRTTGKQYGPRLYKRWKGAIDRRMDRLIKFYEGNGFTRTEDIGVCFEWQSK